MFGIFSHTTTSITRLARPGNVTTMSKKSYFFYFVFAVSLLKLILVAGNEIVANPNDSESYVRQAAYHLFELGVPPGYPFWLAFSKLSGLPQRISIELLLIGSSLIMSGLIRAMVGGISGALAFAMLVLSPATYFLFDYALSDGFYSSLGILAIALSAGVIFAGSRKRALVVSLLLGCSMGWMALSRNEDPILIVWAGLIVLLGAYYSLKTDSSPTLLGLVKQAVLVGAAIAIPAVAIVQSVNLVHLKNSGVFARTLAGLPGHMRLLHNLAEIDAAEPSVRYVPISAKARSLAYMSSPTLAKYEKSMEDANNIFHVVSRQVGLPIGEIGAGWIWHSFNSYILQANGILGAEAEYEKINEEIEGGFKSGVLKKRRVLHSFATAPILEIALRLPSAMWQVAQKSFQTYHLGADVGYEKEVFDAVNLRRTELAGGGFKHSVQGWAFVEDPTKKIKFVISVDEAGQSAVATSYMQRPDVVESIKRNEGWQPSVTGFKLTFFSSSKKVGGLLYMLEDGSTVFAASLPEGVHKVESSTSHGLTVNQGIELATAEPVLKTGIRHRAQVYVSSIANADGVASFFLVILLGLGAFSAGVVKYPAEKRLKISIFIFMVVALLALRVAFYAILESEAWGVEVRYMLAGNFMATILIAVWLPCSIGAVQKMCQGRARRVDAARH